MITERLSTLARWDLGAIPMPPFHGPGFFPPGRTGVIAGGTGRDEDATDEKTPKPSTDRNQVRSRILVIEDDPDVRQSLVEILQDNDFETIEATNGADALAQLRAGFGKPCLILLDIMMPVMDGWQFRALQEQDAELRDIPVVVLTAHANIAEAAARMRGVATLKKPVKLDVLIAAIRRFCRSED